MKKPLIPIIALLLIGIVIFLSLDSDVPNNDIIDSNNNNNSVDSSSTPIDSSSPDGVLTKTDKDDKPWYDHKYRTYRKDAKDNKYLQSVLLAHDSKKYPERLSVQVRPPSFDPVSYRSDPDKYIYTIEPGRVFETAEPSLGLPELSMSGTYKDTLYVHEEVVLTVKATPGVPVSWHAFDGGLFVESRLNSITVKADAKGFASVTWFANPGTINDASIIAASPLMTNDVVFDLHVLEKDSPKD